MGGGDLGCLEAAVKMVIDFVDIIGVHELIGLIHREIFLKIKIFLMQKYVTNDAR